MKKTLTSLILCFFATGLLFAQTVVTGKVKAKGENLGMTAVSITIKGQNSPIFSDFDGNYTITIPNRSVVLIFTFSGYETVEVSVANRSVIDVEMTRIDNGKSDNVKPSGFGSLDKNSNVSSSSSIDASKLGTQPVATLEQANQGRAAGVLVQNSGGELGAPAKILIRGGSSLTASNEPLYVVDGIPLTSGNQSDINPNNIASMEVLKDASATALYGARAANGVIIITTKQGSAGKMKIDADYQFGVSSVPKKLDLFTPEEYRLLTIEFLLRTFGQDDEITRDRLVDWARPGVSQISLPGITITLPPVIQNATFNTDWQDQFFQSATSHRTNLSLSGGSDNFKYFSSISYQDQEGIVVGNDFERFNAQLNLSGNITPKLSTAISLSYANNNRNRVSDDADLGNPVQGIALPPNDGFDPNNNYELIVGGSNLIFYNPLTELNFSDFIQKSNVGIGNFNLNYKFSDKLTLNVDAGLDVLGERQERRQGPETLDGEPSGLSRLTETDVTNYLFNSYLNYQTEVSENNTLSLIAGTSYQKSTTDISFRSALLNSIEDLEGLNEDNPSLLNNPLRGGASALQSFYGRVNYNVNNKYVVQLSGRLDGSSRFGPENQYGFFPAISGGWNLSNEDFLKDNTTISFLKLKVSYGIIGNSPTDDFLYRTNYFLINYAGTQGLRTENLANPNIKWEVTNQFDIGLDFGLIEDRLSGSVNYYNKNTTDLLFARPISQVGGFTSIIDNIASLKNSGIEFNIGSLNINKPSFKWTTDFNISSNQNEISGLNGQRLIVGSSAYLEGEAPGVFFLPKYEGVDSQTGRALYADGNGGSTTDYELAFANGREVVGNPNPTFFGGLSNTFTMNNFELSFLFQFVGGVEIYNQTSEILANSGFSNYNQRESQINRWYSPGDDAEFPVLNPGEENTNPSSRFIEDGSYIRLNNLSLTYNLPQSVISDWGLRNMSFYIGGQNLFTITEYSGYDPDVNSVDPQTGDIGANLLRNIDNFTAPQARTFVAGIKIGF